MYRQIFTLEKQVPGFNRVPLTFTDFLYTCENERIRFYYWNFSKEIKGIYLNNGFPIIGLNENLHSPEREIVAFQELGHYYLGHPNSFSIERDTFFLPRIEYEANVFAALCLVPTPILKEKEDEVLDEFPIDFRTFRMKLYKNYMRRISGSADS